MERLGDAKEQVRQDAIEFILKLMSCPGCTPQVRANYFAKTVRISANSKIRKIFE